MASERRLNLLPGAVAISLSLRISARKSRLVEWGAALSALRTRSFGRLLPWQMRIRPRLEQIAVGPGEQHGGVSIAQKHPVLGAGLQRSHDRPPDRLSAHASPERTRRRAGKSRRGPPRSLHQEVHQSAFFQQQLLVGHFERPRPRAGRDAPIRCILKAKWAKNCSTTRPVPVRKKPVFARHEIDNHERSRA